MMVQSASDALLLFLKAPILGTVKTRLAATIGDIAALRVYEALVCRQLQQIPADVAIEIHYSPSDAVDRIQSLVGSGLACKPQIEGNLGDRLKSAMQGAFERGYSSVTCIGGDCPGLTSPKVSQAIQNVGSQNNLVVIPADDGGYCLLSSSNYIPELFESIPWSTNHTLSATLKAAEAINLDTKILPSLYDVDDLPSLKRAIKDGYLPQSLLPA